MLMRQIRTIHAASRRVVRGAARLPGAERERHRGRPRSRRAADATGGLAGRHRGDASSTTTRATSRRGRRRISSSGDFRRRHRTSSGWPTSRTCRPGRASSTWPSCSTSGAARSWAGRWRRTCAPSSCSRRSTWRSRSASPRRVIHHSRPRLPVHVDRVRQALRAGRRTAFDGERRRRLRQRDGRELLRDARVRAARSHARSRRTAEARIAIFEWIEGWYNPKRRHSSIGYLSPTSSNDVTRRPETRGSAPNPRSKMRC